MLYPWDIAHFRQQLESTAPVAVFNLHPFQRVPVNVTASNEPGTVLEPGSTISFTGPAHIFGTPEIPACLNGTASAEIGVAETLAYTLHEAMVIGTTAVLDRERRLYAPAPVAGPQEVRRALARNAGNHEGFVLRPEDEALAAYYFCAAAPRRIARRALLLANLEIGNYGSFLIRVLPQLLAARKLVGTFDCYVASDRAHWLRDAIRLLKLPDLPVFEAREVLGETFETLVVVALPDVEGLMPAWVRAGLRELAEELASGSGEPPARDVYVSRQLNRVAVPQYRPLANEIEIERRLAAAGFEPLCPETLPLGEQIRRFARARRIAGPSGSGMLNAIFATEPARVLDIESFTHAVRQHAKAYASCGHAYAFCFGSFAPDDEREHSIRRWSVPDGPANDALAWITGAV